MKQIKIIIEKSEDFFWAYAVELEGVTAGGETVQEAKKEIEESITIQKELGNIPNEDYQLTYKYDTESFLQYYKGLLSNPALERLTGINQKLIHQYAVGLKKPREAQRKKLPEGLHKLGAELLSIELWFSVLHYLFLINHCCTYSLRRSDTGIRSPVVSSNIPSL